MSLTLTARSATFVVVDDTPIISAATDQGAVFMHLTDETVIHLFELMAKRYVHSARQR